VAGRKGKRERRGGNEQGERVKEVGEEGKEQRTRVKEEEGKGSGR
jgi:hypothetical protein